MKIDGMLHRRRFTSRSLDMGGDMRQLGIAEVMTPGIRVRPGILAVDALNLMQSPKVSYQFRTGC